MQGLAVLAFLDTEFTDLVIRPRLLSVAIVPGLRNGREFYAEVTDKDRIQATNWFGLSAVLPQFGKVAQAACSYAELGTRLSAFLADLVASLDTKEFVELAFGYHLDWELVDLAISDSEAERWESIRQHIHPMNVYEFTSFDAGKLAAAAYYKAQALAPFSRHHALCDARALRVAFEAATQATVGSSEASANGTSGASDRHDMNPAGTPAESRSAEPRERDRRGL